jgi:enoyl-CoA hydratase
VDPLNLGMEGYRRRVKPMVVAVQGITYTLGIELMLAADIVVAADDCRFSQLEVQRGIMATGGATLRMAERAGSGNALLHLLTADVFDSAEALRLNFVQKVVPARGLLAEAMRIAELIAAQAPLAVVATRQNVLKAVEQGPLVAMHDFHVRAAALVAQRRRGRGRALICGKARRPIHGSVMFDPLGVGACCEVSRA